MKKIIKEIDKEKRIAQITIVDERWYAKEIKNKDTGLPQIFFVPSVTWICGFYPKGIAFYKWLAEKGWNEAEAIKSAAGDKGSKVHFAIADLIDGKEITMDAKYKNPSTEQEEELTLEEYECLMSFVAWFKETNPEIIQREFVVWNDIHNYAGTIDFLCKIGNETWIIDFKTGQYIWPEHELQLSAYRHATSPSHKTAILQLGYRRNKNRYKFTEIEDKFNLFLSSREIWANETAGTEVSKKDYPLSLILSKEESKVKPLKDKKSVSTPTPSK